MSWAADPPVHYDPPVPEQVRRSRPGNVGQLTRAYSGLAHACHTEGDPVKARHHWQETLARYTAIGGPEADEIRARLAARGGDGDDGHKPTEEADGATPSP